MERVGDMATELIARIVQAYSRLHPSMYDLMVWRMNMECLDDLVKEKFVSTIVTVNIKGTFIFSMPVEIADIDEPLLVMKV